MFDPFLLRITQKFQFVLLPMKILQLVPIRFLTQINPILIVRFGVESSDILGRNQKKFNCALFDTFLAFIFPDLLGLDLHIFLNQPQTVDDNLVRYISRFVGQGCHQMTVFFFLGKGSMWSRFSRSPFFEEYAAFFATAKKKKMAMHN